MVGIGNVVAALELECPIRRDSGLAKRLLVSLDTLPASALLHVCDDRDPLMPLLQKMPRCQITPEHIVEAHGIACDPFEHAVDHQVRDGKGREHLCQGCIGSQAPCCDKKDPVDAAVHEKAHECCIIGRHIVRIRDQKRIALSSQALLEILGQGAEEAALDVGDDEAQGIGALGDKAACNLVRHIALLAGAVEDGLALGIRDAHLPAIQHERDRGRRHAYFMCDVLERHLAHSLRPPRAPSCFFAACVRQMAGAAENRRAAPRRLSSLCQTGMPPSGLPDRPGQRIWHAVYTLPQSSAM